MSFSILTQINPIALCSTAGVVIHTFLLPLVNGHNQRDTMLPGCVLPSARHPGGSIENLLQADDLRAGFRCLYQRTPSCSRHRSSLPNRIIIDRSASNLQIIVPSSVELHISGFGGAICFRQRSPGRAHPLLRGQTQKERNPRPAVRTRVMTRRQLATLALGAGLQALRAQPPKWKVVVTGGHPGDPEYGCGGTIARYTDQGHDVAVLYLNRGEKHCPESTEEAAANVRVAEAKRACAILKARPIFAAQCDAHAVVDSQAMTISWRLSKPRNPMFSLPTGLSTTIAIIAPSPCFHSTPGCA